MCRKFLTSLASARAAAPISPGNDCDVVVLGHGGCIELWVYRVVDVFR